MHLIYHMSFLVNFRNMLRVRTFSTPFRRTKMERIMRLLGVDFEFWTATDGNNLDEEPLSKNVVLLPSYEDPFHKRPMKTGEVMLFAVVIRLDVLFCVWYL